MFYLELLRIRRVAIFYSLALAGIALFIVFGARLGTGVHIDVNNTTPSGSNHTEVTGIPDFPLPFGALVALSGFAAIGFATALAGSFNRETAYAHFTFVLPLTRVRMAIAIGSLDIAGIVLAGFFALVVSAATVSTGFGDKAHYVWSANDWLVGVLAYGSAIAWYGMLQCATAWAPMRAGQWAGLCGAVMGLAIPLSAATFVPPVAWLAHAILLIDPLAYFTSVQVSSTGNLTVAAAMAGDMLAHAAAVWAIAAVALALSTVLWRRVEV